MHLRRLPWIGVSITLALVVAASACSSGSAPIANDVFGSCKARAGAKCARQDLREVNLENADLHGIDLSGADLQEAILVDANLRNANLTGANLIGANLRGADLRGANLTRAHLDFAVLADANTQGANFTGAGRCQMVLAEGEDLNACPPGVTTTTRPVRVGPPRILLFKPVNPNRCLDDAAGTGIDVQWATSNAPNLIFQIDGIQVGDGTTTAHGTDRLPFICDGKRHVVTLQAFGFGGQPALRRFTLALSSGDTAGP